MLIGHQVVAVLDGDEPAHREGEGLVDRLLGDANRAIFVGDYIPAGNTSSPDDY